MDFLKNQWLRIQKQLAGLTPSQKMLAASLVVIMVMTIFWWGRFASTADMEPVLDTAFKPDDITRITLQLQAKGIPYKVNVDRILVASDRKSEALAELAYDQLLPRDTSNAFDAYIQQTSPFDSKSKTDAIMMQAKQATLASLIRQWPNVSNAAVIIDSTTERGLGDNNIQPSATINLVMKSDAHADDKLVNAAASLVAGAVANLEMERIHVIADGIPARIHNSGSGSAADEGNEYLALVEASERQNVEKLRNQLSFIPAAMISVSCEPNLIKMNEIKDTPDSKSVIVKPLSDDTESQQSNEGAPAAEPGALPNEGLDLNQGSATPASMTKTDNEKLTNDVIIGHTQSESTDPGGKITVTSAALLIPRSYFVDIYKQRNGTDKEPDDVVLQAIETPELAQFKDQIRNTLNLTDLTRISAGIYNDIPPKIAATEQPTAASAAAFGLGGHVKEIALGALALVSLFMMSMTVRKSAPAAAPVPVSTPKGPVQLSANEETVGEVTGGGSTLDAMEVDDDSVRAEQMLDQVSTMVKDNPDGAANLVKRWMNRS